VIENRGDRNQIPAGEIRCCCGSLLARRTPGGIELKCRRCRRSLLVTVASDGSVLLSERPPGRGP
jgi:hypothetical protein